MHTRYVCVIAALFAAGTLGCSRDKTAEQVGEMNKSNIQRISNMYAAYQNMKGAGSGPKDEADLKAWIKEYSPEKLSMMKIDVNNLDGLFTSERDNKPFKIRYKVGGGRGSVAPVVFEQDGVGGKKQVGFTGGKVEHVDDAEYKQLWEGKTGVTGPSGGPGGGPGGGGKDSGRPPSGGAPAGAPKGPPGQ
jgi:hypothetical protein